MRRCEFVVFVLVAGLGCGPDAISAETETESSTHGDGDGDGDPGCQFDPENDPVLDDLQTIIDGAVAYFEAEHPIDDEPSLALHHCPFPVGLPFGGETSFTPDIALDCNAGPACKCAPAMGGGGVGIYDVAEWTNDPVWQGIGFAKDGPHAFHYNFIGINDLSGYGSCAFTAQAWGDIDDDALFTKYEWRGIIDENGVTLEPFFVENEGE